MSTVSTRIGFIPSYRGGYGPIPSWCIKMREQSLAALAKVEGLEVIVPQPPPAGSSGLDPVHGYCPHGAVHTLDEAEVVAEYFQREKVDGIIICALNFGDERSACKVAEKLRVPTLLYATKEPPAMDDPSLARVSDSYCGTLSIASGLYRRKLPFHYAGIFFPEEPEFLADIATFVRAVAVVKALRNARIGQVGVRPETFETVGYDESAVIRKFGQNIIYKELSDIVLQAQAIPDDDPTVRALVQDFSSSVAEVTVADDWLLKDAKLELALVDFWNRNGLSAMAIQCWPAIQQLWGMSVCALLGRMTQRGMLTACEVDVLGALAMLASYHAALGHMLPHFVDWTIQHRENPNWLLAWHCGNAPISLANDVRQTALRSRFDMTGKLPVKDGDRMAALYQFQLRPGPVTFCRLAEYDDEWKMLIATGEIVPSNEVLAGTWSWVAVPDHTRLYRTLVEEGFIHHASMIHGDQTAALSLACKFLDIRPIVVS